MKISDKTDEDVATILGLIVRPVASVGSASTASGQDLRRASGAGAVAIFFTALVFCLSGVIGWSVLRTAPNGATSRSAHGGHSYADVVLDASQKPGQPRRPPSQPGALARLERSGQSVGLDPQSGTDATQADGSALAHSAAHRGLAGASASRRAAPEEDRSSSSFTVAKAESTPEPVVTLALRSDAIGEGGAPIAMERPNFALTPAAREERLDALDAVRLLRQR